MSLNLVLHVDLNDPQRLNLAFDNVNNYLAYLAERSLEAKVVVVGNGPVVNLFVKKPETAELAARGADLMARGVSIRLCRNALRKFQIEHDQVWDGCEVITAAVPELVNLQNEGYSYIKP